MITSTLARAGAALVAAAGLALLLAVAAPASPGGSLGKRCSLGAREQQHLGATYVTSLSVSRTSCGHGKSVVRSFNRCRKAHGRRGHCTHRVLGYRCRERRAYGQGLFSGRVGCSKGRARVNFTYSQFD